MNDSVKFHKELKDKDLLLKRNSELETKCRIQKQVISECKNQIGILKDDIVDLQSQSEQQQSISDNPNNEEPLFSLRKTTVANRSGKGVHQRWGYDVVFIIIQLLAVDTKPTAIQSSLQIFEYLYTGKDAKFLPSVNYIRQCRLYATIINELIAAMQLGKVPWWSTIYHDGTSRRQCHLYNLLFSIVDKWSKETDPMIVSSCIVLMEGNAEGLEEAITSKV